MTDGFDDYNDTGDPFGDGDEGKQSTDATGSDAGQGSAPDAVSAGQAEPPKGDKRYDDLMSKWQKAEARAVKAEKALAGQKGGSAEAPPVVAEVESWLDIARSTARDRLFESDPRFTQYGIERSSINGETPEEMLASFERQKKLLDTVETQALRNAQIALGMNPELGTTHSGDPVDYASMSREDFQKLVRKAKGGY